MTEVVHGGVTTEELEQARAQGIALVDLSASLNPYGPLPSVIEAAQGAVMWRYPQADAHGLREQYAAVAGLDASCVLAGNGSSELIYLVARALGAGGRCLVLTPTFGEYAAAARAAGMTVDEWPWFMPGAGAANVDALIARIRETRPSLVYLCNPNNPTGDLLGCEQIEAVTQAVVAVGGRLLVDEAYMDFAWPDAANVAPAPGRLVLRTLTKMHAIPGLRIGFLLGQPGDIAAVRVPQPPWPVSAPAEAAARRALREPAFARESQDRVAAAREALRAGLLAAGFVGVQGSANFLLVPVGEAPAFRARVLRRGYVLRDCTSFGLPGHVRIAVPAIEQVEPLLGALKECRECGEGRECQ